MGAPQKQHAAWMPAALPEFSTQVINLVIVPQVTVPEQHTVASQMEQPPPVGHIPVDHGGGIWTGTVSAFSATAAVAVRSFISLQQPAAVNAAADALEDGDDDTDAGKVFRL